MKKGIIILAFIGFVFNFVNAQNVLINESFETWPAEGWVTYKLGALSGWEQDLALGHTGDHCAKHPGVTGGQSKNWLVSPQISLDNTTDYQLSFFSFGTYISGAFKVMISTASADPNSGDFEQLLLIDQSTWWIPMMIDLSAYQGQDIYIAFYAFSNASLQVRVDDILIAPLTYFDAALTEIVSPTGFNPNTGMEDVVVKVTNHGTETITDFSVQWTVNDVFQTQFDGTGYNLLPDSSIDVTIGQFDFAVGMYSIAALINVTDDAWADNNLATAEYSAGVETDLVLNMITPTGSYPTVGTKDVIVNVTNNGTAPITEIVAEWSVDGFDQPDFNINSLDIQSGEFLTLTIGQYNFTDGIHHIEVTIPLDFDQTPDNNSKKTTFTVGGLYQDFQGEFPPIGWTTNFSTKGNFAAQNNDPDNYHIYMIGADFALGTASDTLYTPLLNIANGDSVRFMGRFPTFIPGHMSLVWKDGTTGEVHTIIDPVSQIIGWSEFNFDISAAAGINYIGWVCSASDGNAIGDFNMDDLYVSASPFLHDNDLMVTDLKLDTLPKINNPQLISARVLNIGLNAVSGNDYTVKIMSGTTELTSVNGVDIPATGEVSFEIPYTFTTVGNLPLHIEISYADDQSLVTNVSPITDVYPVPENSDFIVIGEPQAVAVNQPFNFGGDEFTGTDDISQNIYYANEIGTSGKIYGIKYPYDNGSGYSGTVTLQVWLAQTNIDDLESGWLPFDNFTMVFDGEVTGVNGDGYIYIPFDTPIDYDGTQNIVIQNYATNPSFIYAPIQFFETISDGVFRSLFYANRTNIDPTNPSEGYTKSTNFPFVTFVLAPNADAGVISGKVFDENNIPVANADVVVDGSSIAVQTNDTGAYELPLLNYDEYSIVASTFGYDADTQIVTIGQPEINIDFFLNPKPLISVSGSIAGSNDPAVPIPNVNVVIDGYNFYQGFSNESGGFAISNVYGNAAYEMTLSIYGYDDYVIPISSADQNIDLGNIIMQETMLSTFNVFADENNGNETMVSWSIPNTGIENTIVNDGGVDFSGLTNDPNENVWLGNYFENNETITINSVDVHWTFIEGGVSDFVTVEILNSSEEVIAVSERFLTPFNQWITIDIPNITVSGDFFVMIHWEENPESTNYFSYNWSWEDGVPNTGMIKYPGENAQLITEFLQLNVPSLNMMIRPNIIEEGGTGNDNNSVTYNVYRGLADDMDHADEWIAINSNPILDLFYTDDWSNVPANGTYIYAVESVYTEGVSAFTFSNTIDIIITGIEDIIENNISVYPNPASEFINITGVMGSDLYLYNVMGKLIYSEQIEADQTRLNVADLPAGNYILNIITDGTQITKKISITKR